MEHGVELLFRPRRARNLLLEGDDVRGRVRLEGNRRRRRSARAAHRGRHRPPGRGLAGAHVRASTASRISPGTVDIGVRVEVRNEIMETREQRALRSPSSSGYPKPFKNKVRTFCQNPGGFVSQENYDKDLAVVNGHSYKERQVATNTNLAILCSHNFSEPFNQPIAYAQKVGELTNMLGDGHILVQRFGDILDGKRTWQKELARSNVRAHAARRGGRRHHRRHALPCHDRTSSTFMQAMDEVVPGFAAPRDAALLARAEVLLQPREDGRAVSTPTWKGLHVPGRLQRLDARA